MASLEDRWYQTDPQTGRKQKTDLHGHGRRWRVRYRDPAGKHRAPTFDRRDDALRHKAEVEGRLHKGTYIDPDRGKVTVGQVAEQYLATVDATRKPSSAHGYREVYEHLVAPRWAAVPVQAVTYGDIQLWVGRMIENGLSASRVRHGYRSLRAVLTLAMRDNRIERNPALNIQLPALPMKSEHQYLTAQQVIALADECGERWRPLVLVLGFCGLRWGEAAGLRISDVDVLRRRLHIRRNLTEVNGHMTETTPKTHQARWVPLPPFVLEAITPLMTDRNPDDLLFTSQQGGPIRNNFRRRVFQPAAERSGLGHLKIHTLRHAAASIAIQSGATVKDVQRMLGHAQASMTLDVYADLFEDGLDDLARRIGEAANSPALAPTTPAPVTPLQDASRTRGDVTG